MPGVLLAFSGTDISWNNPHRHLLNYVDCCANLVDDDSIVLYYLHYRYTNLLWSIISLYTIPIPVTSYSLA